MVSNNLRRVWTWIDISAYTFIWRIHTSYTNHRLKSFRYHFDDVYQSLYIHQVVDALYHFPSLDLRHKMLNPDTHTYCTCSIVSILRKIHPYICNWWYGCHKWLSCFKLHIYMYHSWKFKDVGIKNNFKIQITRQVNSVNRWQ